LSADDAYLADLRRAKPAAVERLVADYEGPLFRYFLAIHGDAHTAGEQSAESFVELVRALPKMRGGAEQLRGFVYAIARNVERRRWRQRTSDHSLDAADGCVSPLPGPGETLERREQLERALGSLRRLDATTREVFVLAFVEQLPLAEVARALNMPLGTVKSRIHRGRQELKAMLHPDETEA
jgi:RNA polymerase sigma-70 factor (ECF subfamily)